MGAFKIQTLGNYRLMANLIYSLKYSPAETGVLSKLKNNITRHQVRLDLLINNKTVSYDISNLLLIKDEQTIYTQSLRLNWSEYLENELIILKLTNFGPIEIELKAESNLSLEGPF